MLYKSVKNLLTTILFFFIFVSSTNADFYVIPVVKNINNLVTVAKTNADYTNLQSALDSITDASSAKIYYIHIAAGEYEVLQTISMKPYVHIVGSDKKNTILTGAITAHTKETASIINGANNASLSEISIVNTSAIGTYAIGVYNDSASPILDNLDINVSDADVVGSTSNVRGILNENSASPTISNSSITAVGDINGVAISDRDGSSSTISNVTAIGTDKGISTFAAYSIINHSTIKAIDIHGLSVSGEMYIYNSSIAPIPSASPSCYNCVDEDGLDLNASCSSIP